MGGGPNKRVLLAMVMLSLFGCGRDDASPPPATHVQGGQEQEAQAAARRAKTRAEARALPQAQREAFFHAIEAGEALTVQQMLDRQPLLLEASIAKFDQGTPLIATAWTNQPTVASVLIARGADLEAQDDQRRATALSWAGYWGSPEVAKLLIDAGAKVNHADAQGVTPLTHTLQGMKDAPGRATPRERNTARELIVQHGGVERDGNAEKQKTEETQRIDAAP
ncbi:MAG: ankyrin repeat domain-containing protein [Phycisphaeraceae bacterium]